MHPTLLQRLFTDDRPLYFLMGVGSATAVIWTGSILVSAFTLSVWNVIQFLLLIGVAAVLGAVLGAFPGGMFFGALLMPWIERRNGAPFKAGDEVIILSKRFPGRMTRVYAVWAERRQVRVELGDEERRKVTDVFSYTDVCRRSAAG